jgi:hypothetical protein
MGGLGILDLKKFSRALRLRWLWMEWSTPNKPWVGMETPNDETDQQLFNALTKVTVGNWKKASFWSLSWLHGTQPRLLAPKLFAASKRKKRVVFDAIPNHKWISDLRMENFSAEHIAEFIHLRDLLQEVHLLPESVDIIVWTATASGKYSSTPMEGNKC